MPDPRAPLRIEFARDVEGLRVVRQPAPAAAASFSASYVGPAGWGFDPPGEEGAARSAAQLVTAAAGPFDRVALARRLDRAGATLSQELTPEAVELTIWGPADAWKELLGLLAVVVRRPRFDPDDIERVRRQLFERQLRETTQPAGRADRELLRVVFPPGHPYRRTGLGDRRSVARLDRDALVRFHETHYRAEGAALVVTARAPAAAVEAAARRSFGGMRGAPAPALAVPSLGSARPRSIELDLPGRSQVEVRLGGPSIAESDPEYPAAYLANQVLGGRQYLSRLFQRVRERNGLAYHASSHLESLRLGGIWTAQAGTGGERWRRVVPMVAEEVERIRRRRIPDAELRRIRESVIGELPLALESTDEAHALAVEVAYHDLPADFWLTWPDRLRAARPVAVEAAAQTAFERNRSATVVAGPLSPLVRT